MDLINIAIARDASERALIGARHDDPVVPESPSLLTRARRALARTRRHQPPTNAARPKTDPAVTAGRRSLPSGP